MFIRSELTTSLFLEITAEILLGSSSKKDCKGRQKKKLRELLRNKRESVKKRIERDWKKRLLRLKG
jgi:hypothetical protein